jgi:uncharacterized protein
VTQTSISIQPIRLDPDPSEQAGAVAVELTPEARAKEQMLLERLSALDSALVAYSGGVDSTYLLWAARRALDDRVLAVIGRSDSLARSEFEGALEEAARLGARVEIVQTGELSDPRFRENPIDRCYHCKNELYGQLGPLAEERQLAAVLDGTNADDLGDYRPGQRAAGERGVLSPLAECGLTKSEIRALARRAGLSFWDKPAMPCLASRFPYGTRITAGKLRQIEEAEALLRSNGFRECRVRHHGEMARIEVPRTELGRLLHEPLLSTLTTGIRALGFRFVTVDLEGFRSGRLNEALAEARKSEETDT